MCDFFELTDPRAGESYKSVNARLPIQSGDIVLGDRGYCHRDGIAYVKDCGGDMVVRLNSMSFPLLDSHSQPLHLLPMLRTLKGRQSKEWSVRFEASSRKYTARLCAVRKNSAAAQRAKEAILREAKRKQKRSRPETLKVAEYIFILTTLAKTDFNATMVLELYRAR